MDFVIYRIKISENAFRLKNFASKLYATMVMKKNERSYTIAILKCKSDTLHQHLQAL